MLNIRHFVFNPFQERTYVIWDGSRKGTVIDPGFMEEPEQRQFFSFLEEHQIELQSILLTHAHIDHIYGVSACIEKFPGIKVYMSPQDKFTKENSAWMAEAMRMPLPDTAWTTEDIYDGQALEVGEEKLEVISTPGHTPGGVCFFCRQEGALFSGDTLFSGSVGRTDLPGGDYDKLIASITEKLADLDSDVSVHPGHGWDSTMGTERICNPFLQIG
ncbi:MAG: MBL fold metallo-hydrolase [Bacteroidales bacterium]|nr:MBL fold metallo-hydrolase [Bacteroidales bacterium]